MSATVARHPWEVIPQTTKRELPRGFVPRPAPFQQARARRPWFETGAIVGDDDIRLARKHLRQCLFPARGDLGRRARESRRCSLPTLKRGPNATSRICAETRGLRRVCTRREHGRAAACCRSSWPSSSAKPIGSSRRSRFFATERTSYRCSSRRALEDAPPALLFVNPGALERLDE